MATFNVDEVLDLLLLDGNNLDDSDDEFDGYISDNEMMRVMMKDMVLEEEDGTEVDANDDEERDDSMMQVNECEMCEMEIIDNDGSAVMSNFEDTFEDIPEFIGES